MGIVALTGAMSAYGQYQEGRQQKKYYNYLADVAKTEAEYNYRIGQKQSQMVQDAAKYEDKDKKREILRFAAAQKASIVANGIDLSSVTASDLVGDTISGARADELAIRFNADAKSWSIETDAQYKRWAGLTESENNKFVGAQAMASAKRKSFNTLLSTASSLVGGAYAKASGATAPKTTGGGNGVDFVGNLTSKQSTNLRTLSGSIR
jgi:hypothetical protein